MNQIIHLAIAFLAFCGLLTSASAGELCDSTIVQQFGFYTPPHNDIELHQNYLDKDSGAERKTILALKTNLLYDALTLANFSIEAPIYKDKVSILYYHQFPWWNWGQADNEYCIRFLSIGAEARWWFKTTQRFNSHFLGAYAESGKYDLEFQREICYQGEFYSTGLTYGYAMPVGKHLNIEFSLSAGYASVAYRGYNPSSDYEILFRDPSKVGRIQYFGPTKAQISLVIPIKIKTKKEDGQ